jgi:hypothetical protein
MKSADKCGLLAMELHKLLSGGITLSSEVIHYIDSTFFNPTTPELQTVLYDDSNCEKDSLIELLLFPDEAMQLQLEALLERLHLQEADEKSVMDYLLQKPVQVAIRFPAERGYLYVRLTEDVAGQFISRLNISKHLNPDLIGALNHYDDENLSNRIKVKMRNSRFTPTNEKIKFMCLFFEKFDVQGNDIFECLDLVLSFLDEPTTDDIYRTLMAKKKFYFRSLQQAKQLETQLQKHNMETLLAKGKRVVLIDPRDARKKMRFIDRISRAVFGKTEYFEPLHNEEEHIDFGPDQNVQDIIRILS